MALQCAPRKVLRLGRSRIHGWGAFATERIEKNELISEYCGEKISQEEAERRGSFYDKLNKSYLFQLNNTLVCDAARKGNKIKFANHSNEPNSVSRVMYVNGDHRIGIYALQTIEKGDEILFDYNHNHDGTSTTGAAPEWFVEQQLLHEAANANNSRAATKQACR
jgi:histone-lysine N-methyltransferase EZH2